MAAETLDFFSRAIKKGVFDARYGNSGSKQIIAATDPFVLSGALSKDEQNELFRELSHRTMKSINDRHAGF
jgi:hypothetical protein